MGLKKFSLGIMLGSLIAAALMCISMIWFGTDNELVLKILGTTCTMGGFSLTALACSILYENQKFLIISCIGLAISAFGILFGGLLIWEVIDIGDGTAKVMALSVLFSVAFAHVSIMLNMYKGEEGQKFQITLGSTLTVITILTGMIAFLILDMFHVENETFYKTLWTFSILAVLGTIATPIMKKVDKIGQNEDAPVEAEAHSDDAPEKEAPAEPEKDDGPHKQDAPEPEKTD